MSDVEAKFRELFPEIVAQERLAPYSTFQIGGPADLFYRLRERSELGSLVKMAKNLDVPVFILGGGSNILFADEGFRGLVIKMELNSYRFSESAVWAEAGVIMAMLLNEMAKEGMSGLEGWMGLPGTVGAAVRGNAGCNGLEVRDCLVEAEIFDPESGEISLKEKDYFNFGYRESRLKHSKEIVLAATFALKKREGSAEDQKALMAQIRRGRIEKQPFGATTGSFFKNPAAETPAGLLIEKAGIKGHTIGGAQISEKHGNFFLNLGGATAAEMRQLCEFVQTKVYEKFGVKLEPEVQILKEVAE